jgi:hypothetical protein
MAVSSIPKRRLVDLILGDLGAASTAKTHFRISAGDGIEDRLSDFSKSQLLDFISSRGLRGQKALKKLSISFPIRRSPTLYLTIIENKPSTNDIQHLIDNKQNTRGLQTGLRFKDGNIVRSIFLPDSGMSKIEVNGQFLWEIQLHYEHRFDYVESDPEADNYGELTYLYSLETAIVWIPGEKYFHAIVACSDYPALRRIREFLALKLGIQVYPPTLSREMLQRITKGASPRSVTYTLNPAEYASKEPQNITISDPLLESKDQFRQLSQNQDREQVSGFYTAHPGLPFGGMGVARRDGKIWTPRRLDHNEILKLTLSIIEQTESELAKTKDFQSLTNYFYLNRARIGIKELQGKAKQTWIRFIPYAMSAQKERNKEVVIEPSLLANLIACQKDLFLLTAAEYDCPSCTVRLLAKCTACQTTLSLMYEDHIFAKCPSCKQEYHDQVTCLDCGEFIPINDFANYARIMPDVENMKSIYAVGKVINNPYKGSWLIQGLLLKHISPKRRRIYEILNLQDFLLWNKQARLGTRDDFPFGESKTIEILNHMKEKCYRDGDGPSQIKCDNCLNHPLNPDWILLDRGTCLLRLFGVPIGQLFDGIHHGREFADIIYADKHLDTGKRLKLGIHVKSRSRPSPRGMGRTSFSVKGLYTQVIYSAYEASVGGKDLDVIGVAMPNQFSRDVLESLAYAVNSLGYSFLAIEEAEWKKIINIAYEQTVFDYGSQ